MRAIVIENPGPESVARIAEMSEPTCARGEVLIAVRAAGVNRADLLQRAGKYPPPAGVSELLGLEVAGVIEGLGEGVTTFALGDRVCALLAGGGYSEKVSVPAVQVMPIPNGLSFEEGAALPEAFITAFVNLFVEGGLTKGERVLIHGGSSGVGTAAIQLAREAGALVACSVGDEKKAERCRELGALLAINYRNEDFLESARKWAPDGVDLILDIVGKEYLEKNLELLAPHGRLVQIATMSGADARIDLRILMSKRLRLIGSVLRSRSVSEKGALVTEFSARYSKLFSEGALKAVIDSTYTFDQVEEAHKRMRSSAHVGKLVLRWAST